MGADHFDLVYGLRKPKNWIDRLTIQLYREEIDIEEFKRRGKELSTRSIDLEMLNEYCDGFEAQLLAYSEMLQMIIDIATDERGEYPVEVHEPHVDEAASLMKQSFGMTTDEIMTVQKFLISLNAERGDPARCGEYTGETAHWIGGQITGDAFKMWKSCKEISHRSHTAPNYLFAISASKLFFQAWIEPEKHPKPRDLSALMRLERARAEKILNDQIEPQEAPIIVEPKEDKSGETIEEAIASGGIAKNPSTIGVNKNAIGSGLTTWQSAMDQAEKHIKAHEGVMPSVKRLAETIGCSRPTMDKAIKASPYLKARQAEARNRVPRREVPLTDAMIERGLKASDSPELLEELVAEQKADAKRDERQTQAASHRQR